MHVFKATIVHRTGNNFVWAVPAIGSSGKLEVDTKAKIVGVLKVGAQVLIHSTNNGNLTIRRVEVLEDK